MKTFLVLAFLPSAAAAQTLPAGADEAQVLRALAILRGRPAIVPLTEATNAPLPTAPPVEVTPPAPTPPPDVVSAPPLTTPAGAPSMGIRLRRSFPIGSLYTPKNNRGF